MHVQYNALNAMIAAQVRIITVQLTTVLCGNNNRICSFRLLVDLCLVADFGVHALEVSWCSVIDTSCALNLWLYNGMSLQSTLALASRT